MPWLQLRFDYNTTTIWLWHNYDPTTMYHTRLLPFDASKKQTSLFRRSRIVVISQLNRTHIVISITFVVVECVVVSLYRSHFTVAVPPCPDVLMPSPMKRDPHAVAYNTGASRWRHQFSHASLSRSTRNLIPAMKTGWRHLKVPCVLYTRTSILTLTRRQKSTCALYTSAHYTRDFTVSACFYSSFVFCVLCIILIAAAVVK